MLLIAISDNNDVEASVGVLAVNRFNVLMVKNSHEQVFSNSAEYLETIRNL